VAFVSNHEQLTGRSPEHDLIHIYFQLLLQIMEVKNTFLGSTSFGDHLFTR